MKESELLNAKETLNEIEEKWKLLWCTKNESVTNTTEGLKMETKQKEEKRTF